MKRVACFLTSALLSVFSARGSEIKDDEVVLFYPSYAHRDAEGRGWIVRVRGLIFEPEEDSAQRSLLVGTLRRILNVDKPSRMHEILDRRVRLFLVDHERGKKIEIRLGQARYKLEPSAANGHFSAALRLTDAEVRRLLRGAEVNHEKRWVSFQALTRPEDDRRFTGRVRFIRPRGLSIISDIDDTIKETNVNHRLEMLSNTFLREFRVVPGMSALYAQAAREGAEFHYVSGSPWQLYTPLAEFFRAAGYPTGTFHLKHFRLTGATVFELFASHERSKRQAIDALLTAFPERRFVLVGDSGERDPEIYGRVARQYRDQIVAIFIRQVSDEPVDAERLGQAFDDVDEDKWKVFTEPAELTGSWKRLLEVDDGK